MLRAAVRLAAFAAALVVAAPAHADETPPPPAAPPVGVVAPKVVSDTSVTYPEGASGEARVILTLTVSDDGTVRDVAAAEDLPPFTSRAIAAARLWTFEPATRDGKPIAARIKMEVVFRPPVEVPAPPEPEPPPPPPAPASALRSPGRPAPVAEEQVTVRGERVEASRTVTLTRNEVRQIPGTFGDPFRAVEVMPGVTPIVTGLPFFFIRGAPPGNVGYYLDGVRVPLLFHVGAGPSVVHPGLINHVDLYPGGYPARFGRFSGGIVSGETAEPKGELSGEGNIRLFDVGALVETPFAGGRGNVMLGGRYSYTAALLTLISSDTSLDYWDYQARAHYDLGPDDRLGVFAFGSYDYLGERTPTGTITLFGTEFHRIDLRHDHRIGSRGHVRTAVTLGLDRSRQADDRFVRDRILAARSEYTYALSRRLLFRAGTDVQADSYDIDLGSTAVAPSAQSVINFFPTRTDLAIGARADVVIGVSDKLEVTPGVRTDLFVSQGATAVGVDPRIAMKTHVTNRLRVLSAIGLVHQVPSFVVPLPGFQPGGLVGGLQKAWQESMGLEMDVGEGTTATVTGFHNAFYDMSDPLGAQPAEIAGCVPGTFPRDTLAGDRTSGGGGGGGGNCGVPRFVPGTIGPDRSGGGGQAADSNTGRRVQNAFEIRSRGQAYGLELMFKRKLTSRLGGFLSYTLSRSERSFENRTYIATFDRTHVLNAALAFDLGRKWRAGTRVTFYTGLPKAPGDPTDDSTRLDPFFRLDLRLEKRWQLGKTTWLSFVAEWMNATLSKEQVATTCTLRGCEAQLVGPVTIPSLGLEGGF